jgi:A/G-specific adenine glycosylase
MGQTAVNMNHPNAGHFRRLLLNWYRQNQRKLPWRGEGDPYKILVSEIMLQQTRVVVVEDRYKKFINQFPTVQALARAREQTVLAAWSGLGYYRRARNLHAAAKEITKASEFPRTAEALRDLPGIGRYTANAVASIAFSEKVPVVDGNVKRVLHRLTGRDLSEEQYWQAAALLLATESPGDFNQAMMELGAVVCVPGNPLCIGCPVIDCCATRGAGAKQAKEIRKKAVLKYSLCLKNGRVLLQQRDNANSLMPGMWELPAFSSGKAIQPLMRLKHSITVTDYTVLVYAANLTSVEKGRWIAMRSLNRLPLTGLARKIIRHVANE